MYIKGVHADLKPSLRGDNDTVSYGRITPNKLSIGIYANSRFRDRHFLPLVTNFENFRCILV